MPKRREVEKVIAHGIEPDYGNAFVKDKRGRLVASKIGASSGVEFAEVPDITRPGERRSVRIARRVDPLLAILNIRRDGPHRSQFMAAEKLRRDVAIADGAQGVSERLGVSGTSHSGGPTQSIVDAQGRVREAWLAIRGRENNAEAADVVRLVVLGFATIETIKAANRCRHGPVREMLDLGLARLADYYNT